MRWALLGSVLLMGCGASELTNEGMRVRAVRDAPEGCEIKATLRESEGGGLRSFETNRNIVEARLRNEAARLGGNTLTVIEEMRGDTDEGLEHFRTGVAGVTTPNPRCTNCVIVTARVLQCAGQAPPIAAAPPAAPPPVAPPVAPPPVIAPPVIHAPPVVAPPATTVYVPVPVPGPTVIIVQPPPPPMAPPAPPPPQDEERR